MKKQMTRTTIRFKSEKLKNELEEYVSVENSFREPGKKISMSKFFQFAGYILLKLEGWEFSSEIIAEDLPYIDNSILMLLKDVSEVMKLKNKLNVDPDPAKNKSKGQEEVPENIREEVKWTLMNMYNAGKERRVTKRAYRTMMATLTGSYSDNALEPRWDIATTQFMKKGHGCWLIDEMLIDEWDSNKTENTEKYHKPVCVNSKVVGNPVSHSSNIDSLLDGIITARTIGNDHESGVKRF